MEVPEDPMAGFLPPSDGIRYQKLNIKNQSCGVAASRQRLLNFALCILIFDLPGAPALLSCKSLFYFEYKNNKCE